MAAVSRPLDPATLEWLLAGVREMTSTAVEPLFALHCWATFLDRYLRHSTVDSPTYLFDVRDGLAALEGKPLSLFDPVFLQDLHTLAAHPRLKTERVADVGSAIRESLCATSLSSYRLSGSTAPDRAAAVATLLVWHRRSIAGEEARFGIPLTLTMRASTRHGRWARISWDGATGASPEFQEVAATARAAACAAHQLERSSLDFHIHLERRNGGLEGRSLGLPLAVTMLAFQNLARRREAHWIRPDAVLTGEIAEDGQVLPVDAEYLCHKIRAAVGAGFAAMGLPAENLACAAAELERVREVDPARPLPRLVPVAHLREAAEHPALVHALPRRAQPKIERRRSRWLLAAAVAAVAFGLFWFLGNPWTEQARVDLVEGPPGSVRVSMPGFPPRSRTFTFDGSINLEGRAVRLFRLEPSGRPVLFVGTGPEGTAPCVAHLFDLRSGKLLWSRDLSHRAPLSAASYVRNRFLVQEVTAVDLDCDGRTDVIARIQAMPESPCAFVWFDAEGRERGFYGHRGYVWYPEVCDYDHDGKPELFAWGTLNTDDEPRNQSATVVVLNATHFAGWPTGGPFVDSPVAPFDSSYARVIFPPIADHCAMLGQPGYVISVIQVASSPPPSRLMVPVHPVDGPGLVVTLDENLRVSGVVAEDALKALVAQWLAEGRLKESFITEEKLAEYARSVVVLREGR